MALVGPAAARAQTPTDDLPVSLDRIRAALERPPGSVRIDTPPAADFVVHVDERTRLQQIVPSLDFRSGPVPPGGLYAFEQRQRLGQPYAAQPLVSFDVLPLAHMIAAAIHDARRAAAERAAREEVRRALAEFCAEHGCR